MVFTESNDVTDLSSIISTFKTTFPTYVTTFRSTI
jgi:hypothetical protein